MPILSAITAISGKYPDIAVYSNKYFFERKLFLFIGIFCIIQVSYWTQREKYKKE